MKRKRRKAEVGAGTLNVTLHVLGPGGGPTLRLQNTVVNTNNRLVMKCTHRVSDPGGGIVFI